MNNLNSVLVDGNLCEDPEVRETTNGALVCNFRLASNRYYRKENDTHEEANFFDVETWAKSAERCRDKLSKGRNVRVVGRLKHDRWTDPEGQNRSRVKIVADHVELGPLPKNRDEEASGEPVNGTAGGVREESHDDDAPGIREAQAIKRKAGKSAEVEEVPF